MIITSIIIFSQCQVFAWWGRPIREDQCVGWWLEFQSEGEVEIRACNRGIPQIWSNQARWRDHLSTDSQCERIIRGDRHTDLIWSGSCGWSETRIFFREYRRKIPFVASMLRSWGWCNHLWSERTRQFDRINALSTFLSMNLAWVLLVLERFRTMTVFGNHLEKKT